MIDKCWDTDGVKTNAFGDDCNGYTDALMCGYYDSSDFKSDNMCCICGGGRLGI